MPLTRSTQDQAPTSPLDQQLYCSHTPGWLSGIAVEEREGKPGTDTGVLAGVVLLLVLVGLNMRHVRRLMRTITQDLWSVRQRSNAFDDHTAKETRTMGILIIQLCVFEGILLFLWQAPSSIPSHSIFTTVAWLSALAMGLYLLELLACLTVGYVFSPGLGATQWRRGYNASQALLGISLAIPTLVSLFYPALTGAMLILAFSLYIISRIICIAKGFRIFYINITSSLYFILYLCTLEIVPLIAVAAAASRICNQ